MSLTPEITEPTTFDERRDHMRSWPDGGGVPAEQGAAPRPRSGNGARTAGSSVFVSLPVRNVRVSAAFFAALGFTVGPESRDAALMVVGEGVRVRLLSLERFHDLVNGELSHAVAAGGMLTSVSVGAEQEVDRIVARAITAGAMPWPVLGQPGYSGSFRDPDGHLWEIVCPPERGSALPAPRQG